MSLHSFPTSSHWRNPDLDVADNIEQSYNFGNWLVFECVLIMLMTSAPFVLSSRLSFVLSLIILISSCVVSLWKPFNGLILLFSIYPLIFMYKRLQYAHNGVLAEFGNPISLIPQVIIVCLLIRVIITNIIRNRIRRITLTVTFILAIIFLYIFAMFYSFSLVAGIFGLRAVVFPILLFFIGQALVTELSQLKYLFKVIAGSLFLVSAYGFKQYMFGLYAFEHNWATDFVGTSDVGWFLIANQQAYLRIFSTLATPFELGATSMIGPFIIASLLSLAKRLREKMIIILLIALTIITLFATGIRGAWIGFALAFGIWVLIYNTKTLQGILFKGGSRILIILLMGTLVVLLMLPMLSQTDSSLTRRILSLQNPLGVGQMQTRYQRWADALEIVVKNPLGLGTGSSGFTARRFGSENPLIPDSLYIQALIEHGWIGLAIFVVFFPYLILLHIVRFYSRRLLFLKHIHLAIAAVTLSVAVHGFTTPLQEGQMSISLFWLLIGIGTNLKRLDDI